MRERGLSPTSINADGTLRGLVDQVETTRYPLWKLAGDDSEEITVRLDAQAGVNHL